MGSSELRPDRHEELNKHVVRAAEAALAHHRYVSATDVLTGIGLLAPPHVESWRKRRIDFLERAIQANLKKISRSTAMFRQWTLKNGLKPGETHDVRRTRTGTADLQFSGSGDPAIEKSYRTHYVSPVLSGRKQRQIAEKQSRPPQPVVFEILRDSLRMFTAKGAPHSSAAIRQRNDRKADFRCGANPQRGESSSASRQKICAPSPASLPLATSAIATNFGARLRDKQLLRLDGWAALKIGSRLKPRRRTRHPKLIRRTIQLSETGRRLSLCSQDAC